MPHWKHSMFLFKQAFAAWLSLTTVLVPVFSVSTIDSYTRTCKTFGSGVFQTFNGKAFYIRSTCPITLTYFTHNRVGCDITTQRGENGLLDRVEISVNRIRTVLHNGTILVENQRVSLPYDHTYQHIFQYGIYTRLRSTVLPLSVTWHSTPGGIDSLWVKLEQNITSDMTGLCGGPNVPDNVQRSIAENVLPGVNCQTQDSISQVSAECKLFVSQAFACPGYPAVELLQLCNQNIYQHQQQQDVRCSFYKEVVQQCGLNSYIAQTWRTDFKCPKPTCPGDMTYMEMGDAFVPSCSSPAPRASDRANTSTCVCPVGRVLNDYTDSHQCLRVSDCPCVYAGRSYSSGDTRHTKCQACVCYEGKWRCSENTCPKRCLIEGQFVRTFDGKEYSVPGKCTYVASQGLNWTILVEYSQTTSSLKRVFVQVFQERYIFSDNKATFGGEEIIELYQSAHVLVFWQTSMYIQVKTSLGLKMQVQMSPEIQLYVTPPGNHTGNILGLCGNNNANTMDDFTTSSGIPENSAAPFALSWSVGNCLPDIPPVCISTDNEIFADVKCSILRDASGIFGKCHDHVSTDFYQKACILGTCSCGTNLQQCLCVALANYAKACANQGILVGDWRKTTNCTIQCDNNQKFEYEIQACNQTCRSLSGPDPRCGVTDAPVEGCGCTEGTHLNAGRTCTPRLQCPCFHQGGATPPGPIVLDGRQCQCENGVLNCSEACDCRDGKICVHCSNTVVETAKKTCGSLSKPTGAMLGCESGCYCPEGQYEDHRGLCVSQNNCTCLYSGRVFNASQSVTSTCKTCTCSYGQWHCHDKPCPGKCQVFGNGHFQTFDSKWYRFDGHCKYTLVENYCGRGSGSFSVRVESVPCCDEALTCSRAIVLELEGDIRLTLSDMNVTRQVLGSRPMEAMPLYSTHAVGLYIVISVPNQGLTLIWDKHTRLSIQLDPRWMGEVCGLCGNFDSNEMNDLQISGSSVVSSALAFGNSWKTVTPPCSDVTTEVFPCEHQSYCSAWAQRRCMIITGDIFRECHLKVDPQPYYQACVQESCSCEFEGKFLGFCTAVAAYAEACSHQDVCVKWRTPDLCPVYCDYYNERGQYGWHYEACGHIQTCGQSNRFTDKLEGCYPRCPGKMPFYDENTGGCSSLHNCTCYFNDTVIQAGMVVWIHTDKCSCENGTIHCGSEHSTTQPPTLQTTTSPSNTTLDTTSSTTIIYPTTATTTSSTTPSESTYTTTTHVPSTTVTSPLITSTKTYTVTTMKPPTTNTYPTTPTPFEETNSTTMKTKSTSSTRFISTKYTLPNPVTQTLSTVTWSSIVSHSVITEQPTTSVTATTSTNTNTTTTKVPETTTFITEEPTATTSAKIYTEFTTTIPTTDFTERSTNQYDSSTMPTQSTTIQNVTMSTTPSTESETTSTTSITEVTTNKPTSVKLTTIQPTTTTSSTTTDRDATTMEFSTIYIEPTTVLTSTSPETSTTLSSTAFSTGSPTTTSTPYTPTETARLPTTTATTTTTTTTTNVPETTTFITEEPTARTSPKTYTEFTTTIPTTDFTEMSTNQYDSSTMPTQSTTIQKVTMSTTPSTESETTSTTSITEVTTNKPTSVKLTTIQPTTTTSSTTTDRDATTMESTTIYVEPTTVLTSTSPETSTTLSSTAFSTSSPTTTSTPYTPTETATLPTTATTTTTTTTTTTIISSAINSTLPKTTSNEFTSSGTEQTTATTTIKTVKPTTASTQSTVLSTIHSFSTPKQTTATEATSTSMPSTTTDSTQRTMTSTSTPTPETTTAGPECKCRDERKNQTWMCGDTWTEDCYNKTCNTGGRLELTPLICPIPANPQCPRGQAQLVSDGCCDSWKCDCRCDLYGDPHYISFQGVTFDFLDSCTYVLVEERTPLHHLTIMVDNFFCVPGLDGSCAKGIIIKYQNNTATLSINPAMARIESTLNQVVIRPPYEDQGMRFETTDYMVSIHMESIRSRVSLTPQSVVVVNLAMEHFMDNTQGQCGVCGGDSCVRPGGRIEADDCCDKTAYDWLYDDPGKPSCRSAQKNVSCFDPTPTTPPPTKQPCIENHKCNLLHHEVFAECSKKVNLTVLEQNCRFDSCRNGSLGCSTLEQAAEECKKVNYCVDWRHLTNGTCDVMCPDETVYRECRDRLDDYCQGGLRFPGLVLGEQKEGCFCPSGQIRAGKHQKMCVSECPICKGPLGEPKLPGETWESACHLCTCNNQTQAEECWPKNPEPAALCSQTSVPVTSCCGTQTCVEKTCYHNGTMYKVGDMWTDVSQPCVSYHCSREGIQTDTRVCQNQSCPEEDRVWDDKHCCFTCSHSCSPRVSSMDVNVDNCTATLRLPICEGQCDTQSKWSLSSGGLQVNTTWKYCKAQSFERQSVTLECSDGSSRQYQYHHVTSCECKECSTLR